MKSIESQTSKDSRTIEQLEDTAIQGGWSLQLQGVLMDDGWHYWDSNPEAPAHRYSPERPVPPEPVTDYW